jgi:hypothetical protein
MSTLAGGQVAPFKLVAFILSADASPCAASYPRVHNTQPDSSPLIAAQMSISSHRMPIVRMYSYARSKNVQETVIRMIPGRVYVSVRSAISTFAPFQR